MTQRPHKPYWTEPWVPQSIRDCKWSPPSEETVKELRPYVMAKVRFLVRRSEWAGDFDELEVVKEWDEAHRPSGTSG